ncbi:MAG: hypothetical protein JW940_20485 [Polyangiaceae bacterium]|nr:hypothetical protein [Polyangiaceae bacterium]
MRCKRSAAGAAGIFVLLLGASGQAQNADKSAAVTLYDQAQQLMQQGRYEEACPKYAESNRLDPQLGVLLHLADCYEKEGRFASAWATFRDAADLADRRADARSLAAKDRASALEGRLSRLTISVPPESAVSGLEVERDGTTIGSALWGTAVPVDPGSHTVRATAPGKVPWESTVEVTEVGAAAAVTVPALADARSVTTGTQQAVGHNATWESGGDTTAAGRGSGPQHPGEERLVSGPTQRILGYVAGGLGVIGVGVGIAYLVERSDALDDRDAICPASVDCAPGDQRRIDELTDRARDASTLGAVGLVVGGALLAGGAALVLTAPEDGARQGLMVAPLVGRSDAGLLVRQVW